jgi:hypothetical protein
MGYKKIMNLPDFQNTGQRTVKQETQAGSAGKFPPGFWLFSGSRRGAARVTLMESGQGSIHSRQVFPQSSYRISGHHALYEGPHRYRSG